MSPLAFRAPARAGFLLLSALALVASLFGAPRTALPLEQWRFELADGTDAWAAADFDDAAWETVRVPHTWNAFDGQDGGDNDLPPER